MKEARNGLFTETPSPNGNGRLARCYGFTVNVRVSSFYYSRISNRDSVFQRGPERACFRTQYSISTLSDDSYFLISSTITEEIMRMNEAGLASIAFFYFDFRESSKQDIRGTLSSLLFQLSDQSDACCGVLERLYSAHKAGAREPSEDALRGCLERMLMLPDQGPIFIVLDAVDECPNSAGTPSPREKFWIS
jgi:hypothetical protein